jgi:hypothetical protein
LSLYRAEQAPGGEAAYLFWLAEGSSLGDLLLGTTGSKTLGNASTTHSLSSHALVMVSVLAGVEFG